MLVVPAPFDEFMSVVCTRAGHALAPPGGYHWLFINGASMWLTSMSAHSGLTGRDAYFTRLESAPLSEAEADALRQRVKPIVRTPAMLQGDLMRLEADTSTGDHKQIYLFVSHDGSGAVTHAWGIECFHDCDPMDKDPWAFMVVADRSAGQSP